MEAHSVNNEGGAVPQKKSSRKNKSAAKPFYKTDQTSEEAAQQQASDTQQPQERPQTRQPKQGKMYQPKAAGAEPQNNGGEANGSQAQNGGQKQRRGGRQNPHKEEGGNRKNQQRKGKEIEEEGPKFAVNERFDNSAAFETNVESKNPHRAHQVAEASRIQQLLPPGVAAEVQEKVRRIQEVVGSQHELHVIHGVLEEMGFDEEKTISFFIDRRSTEEPQKQRAPQAASGIKWTNVVKKGIKDEPDFVEQPRVDVQSRNVRNPQHHHQSAPHVPQQPVQHATQQPVHQPALHAPQQPTQKPHFELPTRSPLMESFVSSGVMDPEMVVQSLTMAIQSQLQVIQEQTKMLTMMQNELNVITQSGTNEREQLLVERDQLGEREEELKRELISIRSRLEEIDLALEENKKKKAEKISTITNNNFVAALLKKNTLPALPAAQPEPIQQTRPQGKSNAQGKK